MKKNIGFHFRLLLAVFLLICATTFAVGYMGARISHRFVQTRFEDRMSFLAKYLALNAELGVLIDDRTMLKRLATNLLSEQDVIGVAILNARGEELARVSKEFSGPWAGTESSVFLKESRDEIMAFRSAKGGPESRSVIGKVRIRYSLEGMDQILNTMKTRFIWLSAGLACLAGLIFYFLSRSLVAPVSELSRAVGKVAEGDMSLRVTPQGPPETRELASAFNAMLDSLARSRKALEDATHEMVRQKALAEVGKFSLMVAHEVKNPLSIIKSSMDLLKKDPQDPSSETLFFYMEDEIGRLDRLIEDFLSFARPAKPALRPVDLNALLSEIVPRFELQKAGSGLEISLRLPSEPCTTYADADLLKRGLGNVIKNACEANGGKGAVRIAAVLEGGLWKVEIEDEGEGIPPEHMDRIFEPFFTTRAKGTGLGLAHVVQVVKAHGGSITAENKEKGGAVFRVELPLRAEPGESF